jgi:hypothetical protein
MMTVQEPKLKVTKTPGINEKLKTLYINYMQMMIDCAKDPALKEELFTSNDARVKYLNEKVGMTIPDGVHVLWDTKNLQHVRIYIKDDSGKIYLNETGSTLDIVEKLNNGEIMEEHLKVTEREEIELNITNILNDSDIVLKLPFINPASDLMLFELKYDNTEIIFSTCVP